MERSETSRFIRDTPYASIESLSPVSESHFDFHGTRLIVTTEDAACAAFVASDFSRFRVSPSSAVDPIRVDVSVCEPPYDRIPTGARVRFRTKDALVYESGNRRFLDSDRSLLVIQDFALDRAELFGLDRERLCEKTYLMIMSRLAERLDRQGLHRIHAMGVVYRDRAVLCVLPMGGGKTTLTLGLLEQPGFSLLSDEAPLVGRDGRLHPFPIRLGVCEGTPLRVPDEFLKPACRSRHGPKVLIDAAYFADRLGQAAEPGILFVGRRTQSRDSQIAPLSFSAGGRALWESAVLGRGLPQLLEYIWRLDPRALWAQLVIHFSRARACYRLLRQCERYELRLGCEPAANARTVARFIAERLREPKAAKERPIA